MVQALSSAVARVAIREAAFLCAHYAPEVALAHFNTGYGDMMPELSMCRRTLHALERCCALRKARLQTCAQDADFTTHLTQAAQSKPPHLRRPALSDSAALMKLPVFAAARHVLTERCTVDMGNHSRNVAESTAAQHNVAVVAQQSAIEATFAALTSSEWQLHQLDSATVTQHDDSAEISQLVHHP
jgi:hypothetical protein